MAATNQYLEYLCEWMSPLGEITARAMFGGHCLYCDGTVFALVANNTLYLKADDGNRERFAARALEAFRPFPDKPEVMQYYLPPPEFFDNEDAMREWALPAVEAGRKKRKQRRK